MKKDVNFTVKHTFEGESQADFTAQATSYGNSLNVLTQAVSPKMLEAIAGFIGEDPAFRRFLENKQPTITDVTKFVTMMAKKYAAHLGSNVISSLNPFS